LEVEHVSEYEEAAEKISFWRKMLKIKNRKVEHFPSFKAYKEIRQMSKLLKT